jgi:hypothetical protein
MLLLVPLPLNTSAACCSAKLLPLLLPLPPAALLPAAADMWASSAARVSRLARVLTAFFFCFF